MTAKQHVLILGLGASGQAAAELALRHNCAVTALDERETPALREIAERLANRGAKVHLNVGTLSLADVDFAVISPGIPADSTLGHLAAQLPCPILSELEYGFRHCSCPIVAITGTNGKTTTTELTTHALKHAGLRTMAAGNVGHPLADAALRSANLDCIVAEVSSFQLEHVQQFAPLAAAFLNLSPDHLDRHPDMQDYCAAKLRLFQHVSNPKRCILNTRLLRTPQIADTPLFQHPNLTTFSSDPGQNAAYGLDAAGNLCAPDAAGNPSPFVHRDALKLKGDHNVENVLAAAALCQQMGVGAAQFAAALPSFAPAAHRLELIAVREGVRYVNDSKATNPDALAQALLATAPTAKKPVIHLIAGGVDKNLDFATVTPLLAGRVKQVYLIGASRETIGACWQEAVTCQKFSSLGSAVQEAVDNATSGDTVLLSPGCASFDMFRDYADRGAAFTHEIHRSIGA